MDQSLIALRWMHTASTSLLSGDDLAAKCRRNWSRKKLISGRSDTHRIKPRSVGKRVA